MNNNIRGIVIDPGHGGADPGAIGNGITEKDYTLKISQYMYDRFKELGIPVVMTRDTDITLTPTERANKAKTAFGNYKDVLVISNHINAGGGDGAEVIYALRNNDTLANDILEQLSKAGQNIRGAYQRRSMVNPNNDYYFMQRNTGDTESVTIEYGFLDSKNDDVSQLKNNWQKYAEAAVQGILNYIEGNVLTENLYIVKAGDSLYSIASRYNTTVSEIKRLNNLKSDELSIGQRLKLPVTTSTGEYYVVKAGDTLYSIANKNNMSVLELKKLNNLTSNNLYIGQKLVLKEPNNITTTNNGNTNTSNPNTYVVKLGDTFYSIAKKYNISVNDLKNANNLNDNLLIIGQELVIPSSNDNYYIVKSGDTLYSIARMHNMTVKELEDKNNLTSNVLSVGQKLII